MKLRTFFSIVSLGHMVLFVMFAFQIIELHSNSEKLRELELHKSLMLQKADELRQTSDDLTRFARMYTVTMDKKYKAIFYKIIDIRKGNIPRPFAYEGIYWDLLEPLRSQRHPDEQKVSIQDEIDRLPFSEYERNKLLEAEENSNILVSTEVEAFALIDTILEDKHKGNVKNDVNCDRAIGLLHSNSYLKAKQAIMFPIEELRVSVRTRMNTELDVNGEKVSRNIYTIYFLLALQLVALVATFFFLRKKIFSLIKYFD